MCVRKVTKKGKVIVLVSVNDNHDATKLEMDLVR